MTRPTQAGQDTPRSRRFPARSLTEAVKTLFECCPFDVIEAVPDGFVQTLEALVRMRVRLEQNCAAPEIGATPAIITGLIWLRESLDASKRSTGKNAFCRRVETIGSNRSLLWRGFARHAICDVYRRAGVVRRARPAMPIVLIVDDNDHLRSIVSDFLRYKGYSVLEARSGEYSIELLDSVAVDVVIADLYLQGGLNGIDILLRHRKVHPRGCRILLTAVLSDTVRSICLYIGAEYLQKPLPLHQLLRKIEHYAPSN